MRKLPESLVGVCFVTFTQLSRLRPLHALTTAVQLCRNASVGSSAFPLWIASVCLCSTLPALHSLCGLLTCVWSAALFPPSSYRSLAPEGGWLRMLYTGALISDTRRSVLSRLSLPDFANVMHLATSRCMNRHLHPVFVY